MFGTLAAKIGLKQALASRTDEFLTVTLLILAAMLLLIAFLPGNRLLKVVTIAYVILP